MIMTTQLIDDMSKLETINGYTRFELYIMIRNCHHMMTECAYRCITTNMHNLPIASLQDLYLTICDVYSVGKSLVSFTLLYECYGFDLMD